MHGGWGWTIVVASFMAQLLAYGSPQSVGVLYPEWLSAFQESKGMTAWVGSLVSGIGLIASKFNSMFGLRSSFGTEVMFCDGRRGHVKYEYIE